MSDSQIVAILSRKLVPYLLLFGLYLISFGHLSPGGGFQGGVVLSSAIILLALTRGMDEALSLFRLGPVRFTEIMLFLLMLAVGSVGIFAGRHFLGNFLPSATLVFILNLVIGIKVGAGMSLICLSMLEER